MSTLSKDDLSVLLKISNREIRLNTAAPDIAERVEYLVTFGLAYYDEDDVFITPAGRRVLAYPSAGSPHIKTSFPEYKQAKEQQQQTQQATPYQQREYIIGEAVHRVLGSLFRMAVVYLLGIFTPYHIRLRILTFLGEMLTPIIDFIEALR